MTTFFITEINALIELANFRWTQTIISIKLNQSSYSNSFEGLKLCLPFLILQGESVLSNDLNIPAPLSVISLFFKIIIIIFCSCYAACGVLLPTTRDQTHTLAFKTHSLLPMVSKVYQLYLIVISELSVYHMDSLNDTFC